MEKQKENNRNLDNPDITVSASRNNMPENQVPKFKSNIHSDDNKVSTEAGFLAKDMGKGDFGSEEARADAEKGNKGSAGNMPDSKSRD